MWCQRHKHRADPSAEKAMREAHEQLQKTKERTPEVRAVSTALRTMRERNGFAEQLEAIMEGGTQWPRTSRL
jgi:hypothetical protein